MKAHQHKKTKDVRFSNQELQWRTESTYVDIDTGEVLKLPRSKIEENYQIINAKTKSDVYKTRALRYITYECRAKPYRQQSMFD